MNDVELKAAVDAVMVVLITAADDGIDGLGVRTEIDAIVRPICEAAGRAEELSIRLANTKQHLKEAQVRALKRALKQPGAPPTDPPLWALKLTAESYRNDSFEAWVAGARELVELTKTK